MDRRTLLTTGAAAVAASALPATARAVPPAAAAAATADTPAHRVARALGADPARASHGDGWTHLRLTLPGSPVPLGVDVLADTRRPPRGIAHLLPGGGLNFAANFFTPRARNLAHHLRAQDLLVIGISPREDLAEPADLTASWGQAAHKADAAAVIAAVDGALRLPYRLVGHSAGAALALDLASTDGSARLRRVVAIDTTGPYTGERQARAARTRDVIQARIDAGVLYGDTGLQGLVSRALTDPDGASSVPRPPDPATRFTNAALAHFALTRTSSLPGDTDWIYRQGHSAGAFAFGATPLDDRFSLTHTPLTTWGAATQALGSGLVPHALLRDLAAIWAGDTTTYPFDWSGIRTEVVWVNAALGRGDEPHGAELIRAGGNRRVTFRVVPGHGHADPVWSGTADRDVWPHLAP
ncbi:thioesterase domain-containing protein [Streptomyces cremeus]|uniref:Thioesterase domain-containing protein n=1 Tax=Streptomyces cremeus TaxID=66881 RepID=A0ABV5PN42_STRCM